MSSRLFKHQMASNNRRLTPSHLANSSGAVLEFNKKTNRYVALPTLPTGSSSTNNSLARYSPNGKFLLILMNSAGTETPRYFLFNRSSGNYLRVTLPGLSAQLFGAAAWSPNGKYLFILSHDAGSSTIQWWRHNADNTFTRMTSPSASSTSVAHVQISPDGTYLAYTTLSDTYIRIRKINGDNSLSSEFLAFPGKSVERGLVWVGANLLLAFPSSAAAADVRMYSISGTTASAVTPTGLLTTYVKTAAFSPDGLFLAVAGLLYFDYYKFDAGTNTFTRKYSIDFGRVEEVIFTSDNKSVLLALSSMVVEYLRSGDTVTTYSALPFTVVANKSSQSVSYSPEILS